MRRLTAVALWQIARSAGDVSAHFSLARRANADVGQDTETPGIEVSWQGYRGACGPQTNGASSPARKVASL